MATSWYKYNGIGITTDPLSYTPISGGPSCPAPKKRLCAIFAESQFIDEEDRPIITPLLQAEINSAISTKTESVNVRLWPD